MNMDFVIRCDDEIKENTSKKGVWSEYKPTRKDISRELSWHMAKLTHAILAGSNKKIQEAAADVANLCEKAYEMSTFHSSNRKRIYDQYGDFCGYEGDWEKE